MARPIGPPESKLDAENTLWAALLGIKGFLRADSAKNSALISKSTVFLKRPPSAI
jgi:hypothetical protein